MNKESKILRNLIRLTKKNEIVWSVKELGQTIIYYTKYKITEKKLIHIQYERHLDRKENFIYFEFYNNMTNKQIEIKEIFPHRRISSFSNRNLDFILNKLHKEILDKKPTIS